MNDMINRDRKKKASSSVRVYTVRMRKTTRNRRISPDKWVIVKVGPSAHIYMKNIDNKVMREMPESNDLFFERSILDTVRNMLHITKDKEIVHS
jgi:hypothetical protein